MSDKYVRVYVGDEGMSRLQKVAKEFFQHPGTIARLLVMSQLGLWTDKTLLTRVIKSIEKEKKR